MSTPCLLYFSLYASLYLNFCFANSRQFAFPDVSEFHGLHTIAHDNNIEWILYLWTTQQTFFILQRMIFGTKRSLVFIYFNAATCRKTFIPMIEKTFDLKIGMKCLIQLKLLGHLLFYSNVELTKNASFDLPPCI